MFSTTISDMAKLLNFQEYDNWYRRGYEDSIPPPMPWGLHHKALASLLLVGALSTGFAFMQ